MKTKIKYLSLTKLRVKTLWLSKTPRDLRKTVSLLLFGSFTERTPVLEDENGCIEQLQAVSDYWRFHPWILLGVICDRLLNRFGYYKIEDRLDIMFLDMSPDEIDKYLEEDNFF